MSTISGLGGVNRAWDTSQSGAARKAEHEARMFAKVDSDGSGSVDATELASMLEHTGQSGDSAELLKKMDSDADGSLSSDELSQGMRELMPPPSSTVAFASSAARPTMMKTCSPRSTPMATVNSPGPSSRLADRSRRKVPAAWVARPRVQAGRRRRLRQARQAAARHPPRPRAMTRWTSTRMARCRKSSAWRVN